MFVNWFVVVFAHVVVAAVAMFRSGPRSQSYYSHYLHLTYGENSERTEQRGERTLRHCVERKQPKLTHGSQDL